jgi:hypothetical protein
MKYVLNTLLMKFSIERELEKSIQNELSDEKSKLKKPNKKK